MRCHATPLVAPRAAPRLSVVVSGRNDDYGGDFLGRLTRLAQSLDEAVLVLGSRRVELVVVDWNVVSERPPLCEVIPAARALSIRTIEVPAEVHNEVAAGSTLPLLQNIAQNVGAIRARGRRLIITNADVVIRNDLLRFSANTSLGDRAFVRCDRYDFGADPARTDYASLVASVFVAHVRHGPAESEPIHRPIEPGSPLESWPRSSPLQGELGRAVIIGRSGGLSHHFLRGAHTNAAGDFVCVSRAAFRAAGGFGEDPAAPFHADGLLVGRLLGAGLRQLIYAKPGALLHEDHPRPPAEGRGGGAATWPPVKQKILNLCDGRDRSAAGAPIGLPEIRLAEHEIC